MKRTCLFQSLLIVSTIFWVGCVSENAEDVNQKRIKTNYDLNYDASTKVTEASARFLFGSTYLKLNSPSEVLCNEQSMKRKDLLGIISYERDYNGVLEVARFVYRNEDADVFENTIELPNSIDLSDTITQLSISRGGLIPWLGEKSGSGEKVELSISNGDESYYDFIEAINASAIEIKPNELSANLLGMATIHITRRFDFNLEETPEAGGTGSSTWRSEDYAIKIVP